MVVEAGKDDADRVVEGGAGGDGGVVLSGNGAVQGGVGAADMGDVFRVELCFDTGFAEDEDGGFVFGAGEDAGDVDGGGVGGAEDFVLFLEGGGER